MCILATAVTLALAGPAAPSGEKINPSVEFAATWEAAVEEAKLLNLPIVVHSHGFYCGPCWGMHAAVLQNKKYIQFASQNTVEVISLGSLQDGIDKGERRAATYKEKVDGQEVEYLVEFPGMTVAQMLALNASPAARYNQSGKIPYTAIVDPHTLEEVQNWVGGQAAGTIMKAVTDYRRKLDREHGESVPRKTYREVVAGEKQVATLLAQQEFADAFGVVADLEKESARYQPLADRVAKVRQAALAGARARLDAIEEVIDAGHGREVSTELVKFGRILKGTDLEARVHDLEAEARGS